MSKRIFVGNLPLAVTKNWLSAIFEPYGKVESAHLIVGKKTGCFKGFGLVEMESEESAKKAIECLKNLKVGSRTLRVAEAKSPDDSFNTPKIIKN
ncbi:RNA recognition motif domain-containing protein [Elusimicrobiota bacterium]